MDIQIFYNGFTKTMDVQYYKNSNDESFLPRIVSQPMSIGMPDKLVNKVKKYVDANIKIECPENFDQLDMNAKIKCLDNTREKYNKKIFECIEDFKMDHAELFI